MLLTGCPVTVEQGFFNDCRPPNPTGAARDLVAAAWNGIRADQYRDVHVHLFGNGRSDAGIFSDTEQPGASYILRARRAFFLNAACAGDDEEKVDAGVVSRLASLADTMPVGAKVQLLAFDFTYDEAGKRRDDLTALAVPNEYALKVAKSRPDRFEWAASVHPYRPDAVPALEWAKANGARSVKWLPPAMGIDMASARCKEFYEAMRRLDIPLLAHTGEEKALGGARRHEFANPGHLRHPLEAGVRVIAAHCASLGKTDGVPNFEIFRELMKVKEFEGRLFGDLSAISQANRAEYVPAILRERAWHPRLLNGSDYPLPGVMPITSLKDLVSLDVLDARLIPTLRALREGNSLVFDFVLKRNLRLAGEGFPPSVYETRGFFEHG